MNKVKVTKLLSVICLLFIVALFVKALVWPAGKGEQFAGFGEATFVIIIGLPLLAASSLLYAVFRLTESQKPLIKKGKSFWQVLGIIGLTALFFQTYILIST